MPLSLAAVATFALALAFLACNLWTMIWLGLPQPQPALRRAWIASGGAFAGAGALVWALALTVTPGLLAPL